MPEDESDNEKYEDLEKRLDKGSESVRKTTDEDLIKSYDKIGTEIKEKYSQFDEIKELKVSLYEGFIDSVKAFFSGNYKETKNELYEKRIDNRINEIIEKTVQNKDYLIDKYNRMKTELEMAKKEAEELGKYCINNPSEIEKKEQADHMKCVNNRVQLYEKQMEGYEKMLNQINLSLAEMKKTQLKFRQKDLLEDFGFV